MIRRAGAPRRAGDALEVSGIDDPLTTSRRLGMRRDFPAGMKDPDPTVAHHDLHALADEPPGHAVAVGVDLDRAIGLHPAYQLAHLPEGRPALDRPQGRRLVAPKAHQRRLARRAVDANVGDLPHPP
jgi:hypothetical protein